MFNTKNENKTTLKVVISRMAVLGGALIFICGAWDLFRDIKCEYWPTTIGVIQKKEIKKISEGRKNDIYAPVISYNYQVEGVYYTGSLRAFGELEGSSQEWALEILSRYQVGQTVIIHYNPDNPKYAVLETGIQGGTLMFIIIGIVLVFAGWMLSKPQSRIIPEQTY